MEGEKKGKSKSESKKDENILQSAAEPGVAYTLMVPRTPLGTC